jgi:hypothetical protein
MKEEVIKAIADHLDEFGRFPTHFACGVEWMKRYPHDEIPFPYLGQPFFGLKVILIPAHGDSFSVGRM